MSMLALLARRSPQTTNQSPLLFAATPGGRCRRRAAVEMALPAGVTVLPAKLTIVPKMSVEVPLRPSCHTTSQLPLPFERAIGKGPNRFAALNTTLPFGLATTPDVLTRVL